MREVVVLGGYGHLGRLCVRELAQRSNAHLIVAGRSVQRAEEVAFHFGDRAQAVYCDASDTRSLHRALENADAVVACCGGDLLPAISAAVSVRTPFVGLSALTLDAHYRYVLGEAAWSAQVPVVVQAGALPGLPGVLAEVLVRRLDTIRELRIASTGPWRRTETAAVDARRHQAIHTEGWTQAMRRSRWRFPHPVGARWLRTAASPDLAGFAGAHCVERLRYFEPGHGVFTRALERVVGAADSPFALSACAYVDPHRGQPEARIDITAGDAATLAATVAASLVEAILARELPAGLLTPREAVPPGRILRDLEKSGARVSPFDA